MSKTIAVTVSNAAHKRLIEVQKRLTENRKAKNPAASGANQADTLTWVLENTLLPISEG